MSEFANYQTELPNIDTWVDICFVIDITASMSPVIETVKKLSKNMHRELDRVMRESCGRNVVKLRVRVIGFRDFYDGGAPAIEESGFFNIPVEEDDFKEFLNGLKAEKGGDLPESSLEALALAIRSPWIEPDDPAIKKRDIIVLFTDDAAHPLELHDGHDPHFRLEWRYPENMPAGFDDLVDLWCAQNSPIDQRAKRLALCAPLDHYPWADFSMYFDKVFKQDLKASNGGSDLDLSEMNKLLGETLI